MLSNYENAIGARNLNYFIFESVLMGKIFKRNIKDTL